jgi:hypothetical protein
MQEITISTYNGKREVSVSVSNITRAEVFAKSFKGDGVVRLSVGDTVKSEF